MTPAGERRLAAYLSELREQAVRAREHEKQMHDGVLESRSWASQEDRDWIAAAAQDATNMRLAAEERVAEGEAIVRAAMHGTEGR